MRIHLWLLKALLMYWLFKLHNYYFKTVFSISSCQTYWFNHIFFKKKPISYDIYTTNMLKKTKIIINYFKRQEVMNWVRFMVAFNAILWRMVLARANNFIERTFIECTFYYFVHSLICVFSTVTGMVNQCYMTLFQW